MGRAALVLCAASRGAAGGTTPGHAGCPCVDHTEGYWAGVIAPFLRVGGTRLNITDKGACAGTTVPRDFGVGCAAHDLRSCYCRDGSGEMLANCTDDVAAETVDPGQCAPTSCWERFCYVDPANCKAALNPKRSHFYAGMHYSYHTCGNLNTFDVNPHITAMAGVSELRISSPYGAATQTVTFENWRQVMVPKDAHYFFRAMAWVLMSALKRLGVNNSQLRFINVSQESINQKPESKFTACAHDVALGWVDLCVGDFWETPERMKMTPFTSALTVDNLKLLVRTSAHVSLAEQMGRPFHAFSGGAWALLFASATVTALTLFVVSGMGGVMQPVVRDWHSSRFDKEWRTGTKVMWMGWRIAMAWYTTTLALFGGSSDGMSERFKLQKSGTGTPARIIVTAYSICSIVFIAMFTANSAAILIRDDMQQDVKSIHEAMQKGNTVCILSAIRQEIENKYPGIEARAHIVNSSSALYDAIETGQCDVALISEWKLPVVHAQGRLCGFQYARDVAHAITMPISLPASPSVRDHISWSIADGGVEGDVSTALQIHPQKMSLCPGIEDGAGIQELTPLHLSGIFLLLAVGNAFGVALWAVEVVWSKVRSRAGAGPPHSPPRVGRPRSRSRAALPPAPTEPVAEGDGGSIDDPQDEATSPGGTAPATTTTARESTAELRRSSDWAK